MSVLLDEETVVLDALDFDITCQVTGDHPAEFAIGCRHCDHVILMCVTHLAAARDRAVKIVASPKHIIRCVRCLAEARSFDELFTVTGI